MSFHKLYKRTSAGKIQSWEIVAREDPFTKIGIIETEYGLLGGKIQQTCEYINEGKNVGKANETTPGEQAASEALSRWQGKVKKGYVDSREKAQEGAVDDAVIEGGVFPMLAHKFSDHADKIVYPAYVQPKLDGHRCIAVIESGKCSLWSRTRKRILGVPHIERQLEALFGYQSIILDGELYHHDFKDNFEALSSFIRQTTPKPGYNVVQYWVYDAVMDLSYESRATALLGIRRAKISAPLLAPNIIVVATDKIWDEGSLASYFKAYLKQGFEGAMVRNIEGGYKNKRSYDLQKVKEMADSEFNIVGVEEGRGKMAGHAVFVCETDEGKQFNARMEGPMDELKKFLLDESLWRGKQLTVRYQNLTKDGIPRFPVGVRIHEAL